MFGQLLVTATLMDSYDFAISAPPSWKTSAMNDFVGKIRRDKVDYPSWVAKGQDFEDNIYAVCTYSKTKGEALSKGSKHFQHVVAECYGGTFQNKLQKKLTIGEDECFFFGYTDVDFPGTTKDIKTCLKWKNAAKYLGKNQHKVYLWMNDKEKFEYVVVEWTDPDNSNDINSVHTIPYLNPGSDILEMMIIAKTKEMFEFIRKQNLWNDYYYTFSKNK